MRSLAFALLPLLGLSGIGAAAPAGASGAMQLTWQERIVIRIPRIRDPRTPTHSARVEWREKKAKSCQRPSDFVGAAIVDNGSVDLMKRDGTRIRAELGSDCPSLDFYSGFYITPGPDGMICTDRDAIRSRSGGRCEIDKFRKLVAKR